MQKLVSILLLLVSLSPLISCQIPEKDLTSYESAREWVQSNYKAEVMTPQSTSIHRVEYYSTSPEKWLLVFFVSNKSKGYLYQGFPASHWKAWQAAPSKGKWYHSNLKGNKAYFFFPQKK